MSVSSCLCRLHRPDPTLVDEWHPDFAVTMHYGLTQIPFWHTRPDLHCNCSLHGLGHGPTEPVGADAYSVDEPTAQKRSTGRPSQPQRPPGSKQCLSPLGTMHLPLLSQPPVKPQRWPGEHSESFMQLATLWEPRTLELPVVGVCAVVLAQVMTKHRHSARPNADVKHNFLITLDRHPCCSLR